MYGSYCFGGVFLLTQGKLSVPDGRILLRAVTAWVLSAVFLLLLGALLANALSFGERQIAYLSSAISFLTAAAAGFAAASKRRTGRFGAALLAAAVLVILLLTVGFLIRGEAMNSSAILSLVSFTFAGCLLGGCILSQPARSGRKTKPFRGN